MFLSFPPPTKMFQFRGLAHISSSMSMNFDRLLYLDRESNIEVSLLHALRDVAMFEEQSS